MKSALEISFLKKLTYKVLALIVAAGFSIIQGALPDNFIVPN